MPACVKKGAAAKKARKSKARKARANARKGG